jgi:hypothetical protein
MSQTARSAAAATRSDKGTRPQSGSGAAAPAADLAALQQRLGNSGMNAVLRATAAPRADPLEAAADRFAAAWATPTPAAVAVRTTAAPSLRPLPLPDTPLPALLGAPARPLPAALRGQFERRLGFDLRSVRLHGGARAQTLARLLGARAFTLGRDIVLGPDAAAPTSPAGTLLLAHEVAHVAQQARGLATAPPDCALAAAAQALAPGAPLTVQRQTVPPTPDAADATSVVMPDDVALDAGIDPLQAPAKNADWWAQLALGDVAPLRQIEPASHPQAYANRVLRAQTLLRAPGPLVIEGSRLHADGILGPRTYLALLAVARNAAHPARANIQGLGFDLDAIGAAADAELAARAYARAAETLLQTSISAPGEAAVRYYDMFYSMEAAGDRETFDRALFGATVPPGLRREDRIEMLHQLYGSGELQLRGWLEIVRMQRDFVHTRIDFDRALTHDRRGVERAALFTFAATSPDRLGVLLRDLGLRASIDTALTRQSADEAAELDEAVQLLLGQTQGELPGAAQTAAVLVVLYLPPLDAARRDAVAAAVLAARAEREQAERESIAGSNRESAQQRADVLAGLLTDTDTHHLLLEARLRTELERAVRERVFFDLVLDDLAARPGGLFDRLFTRIEAIDGEHALALLVNAARGGRYAEHARVRHAQAELIRRHGNVREHGYAVAADGDATRGTVLLEGDQRVTAGQVLGDINSAYLRDEDREQLKPDAQVRLQQALEAETRAYMARLLEGTEAARTQDEVGRQLLADAWAAAGLDTDRDLEDVEWQESLRVTGVRAAADRGDGVPRYEVEYERVQRVLGASSGDSAWQAVAGSRAWRSESDFEYDAFWFPYSQMADVMHTAAIVVMVGAVIIVAWEVGVIAALVSAGGGALPVGLSIGISLAIHMLTHERWTLSGLLVAGLEGYLGAVGFRLFAPAGAAVSRMVIPATLERVAFRRVVAAWLLRHGTVGALTGGALGPASVLIQDMIRIAGTGGGLSSFGTYLRAAGTGMVLGAVFEIGGSALLAPLFRNADATVLSRVDEVVMTLNGTTPRLTPSQWMAHVGTSLSAMREYLGTILGQAQARGIYTVFRERVEAAGAAWLAGARGTLHREVIDLAAARISREGLDGFERLLRLGSATLGDDALATLLQQARRAPDRIDPWLRFFSGLDDAATRDLVGRNQLRALLEAEQTLALAARRSGAELHGLLGSHFAHSVPDLEAFALRANALGHTAADSVLEALRTRGTGVTPRALLRAAEAGNALDDELLSGMQRLLEHGGAPARLDGVLDAMADDQVGAFLRGAHTAAPDELAALREVLANADIAPESAAWGLRLPALPARTLLNDLTAAARAAIMDIPAAEAQALLAALTPARVNRALTLGTTGMLRGSHLRALRARWRDVSVIDYLDWAGVVPRRLDGIAHLANNLEAGIGRLAAAPPATAATMLIDTNAMIALESLMRGTPFANLEENLRNVINAIRRERGLGAYADPAGGARPTLEHIVGPGADLRASRTVAAETVAGEARLGHSPVLDAVGDIGTPNAHPDYDAVITDLRTANVGAPKGAKDRTVVADALLADHPPGVVPTLVSADEDIVLALATRFGQPTPFTPLAGHGGLSNWNQLLAHPMYGSGRFTVSIHNHPMVVLYR